MTDVTDEDQLPGPGPSRRWPAIALATLRFAPPLISAACAILAGYFTYAAANHKPPADVAALAVSILKSSDASPEMRDWAADALGIQSDIGMPTKSIQK